jgi:hypothetical protein
MFLSKGFSLALLVVGVVLLTAGVIGSDSIRSDLSRLFESEPGDWTIALLIGGGVATLAGVVGLGSQVGSAKRADDAG